jgi:hypothetical protein
MVAIFPVRGDPVRKGLRKMTTMLNVETGQKWGALHAAPAYVVRETAGGIRRMGRV